MSSPVSKRTVPFAIGQNLRGRSGTLYTIDEILRERRHPLLCVYRASANGESFVIKDMIQGELEYQRDLQSPLLASPNLRCMIDSVDDFELLVYRHLTSDLLRVSQKSLTAETRKRVLEKALVGLAKLHENSIVHNDIKPNNILIDYDEFDHGNINVRAVQIGDLEDCVRLRAGGAIENCLCGNQLWRSPESWARARQYTPSDIFSLGVLAIYVMLNRMVFLVPEVSSDAEEAWRPILWRHISYFGDKSGFESLLRFLGEKNPFYERFNSIAEDPQNGLRKPFIMWPDVNPHFRDLVTKMTNLDPERRITAQEALNHPWFASDAGAWEKVDLVVQYWN